MKSILKSLCIALAATFMLASCGDTYTITVSANDPSMGTVTGGGTYALDETVTLTATPNDGFQFTGWNDGKTENPRTITVTGDAEYIANFQAIPAVNGVAATFDNETLSFGWTDFMTNGQIFLVQAADHTEGNSVYFPYLVLYIEGTSASDMAVTDCELYKDTYFQTEAGDQYGDWQFFSNASLNISDFDATALHMAGNLVNSMYSLSEIVDGTCSDPADCQHKNLSINFGGTFTMATGKALLKKSF